MYGVCWGWCVNVYQLEIFSAKPITLPPTTLLTVHFKFSRVNIDFEHAAGIGIEPGLWCVQQLYSTTLTWYCGEQIAVSQHPQQTIMQHCSTAVCWYRAQSFIICKLSNCIFLHCLCSVARAVHHSWLTSNVETKSGEGYSKINLFLVVFYSFMMRLIQKTCLRSKLMLITWF